MARMSVDIETYSSIDLSKAGVYRYTEAPDFDILLIGYSIDGGPVEVIDCTARHDNYEEERKMVIFKKHLYDPDCTSRRSTPRSSAPVSPSGQDARCRRKNGATP